MPADSVLYLEGTSIAPAVKAYLEERPAPARRRIWRGTLWPRPAVFHLPVSHVQGLRALAERHAEPEICDHLAVYHDDRLLLTAYDAGFGEVYLARSLPEETIRRFSALVA
jgi:hypothetical protein